MAITLDGSNGATTSTTPLASDITQSGTYFIHNAVYDTGWTYDVSNASVAHHVGTNTTAPVRIRSNNIDGIVVDSAGRVAMPYQPAFSAGFSSTQTRTNDTYIATVPWTEQLLFNTGNHFNTSTGTFTAPVAGKYFVGAQGAWSAGSGAVSDAWYVGFRINDTNAVDINNWYLNGPENGVEGAISPTFIFELSAGDTVRVYTGGTTSNVQFTALQFFGYLVA